MFLFTQQFWIWVTVAILFIGIPVTAFGVEKPKVPTTAGVGAAVIIIHTLLIAGLLFGTK